MLAETLIACAIASGITYLVMDTQRRKQIEARKPLVKQNAQLLRKNMILEQRADQIRVNGIFQAGYNAGKQSLETALNDVISENERLRSENSALREQIKVEAALDSRVSGGQYVTAYQIQ